MRSTVTGLAPARATLFEVAVQIELKDYVAWLGRLDPEKSKQAMRRGLVRAALRMVSEIVSVEIPARVPSPVDRGVYRAGWRVDLASDVTVINSVEYADKIENGISPGELQRTPELLDAITAWVVRKQIVQMGMNARSVAWRIVSALINNGVYNRGEGLGIMRAVVEDGRLEKFIREEVSAEMNRFFNPSSNR
jgi:hypothetical protein